eukprot:m.107133 g.107133  ORF g.107133 m.107133 type:complete len:335 (+) comp15831_c0_seq1:194-1198(+)
MADSPAAASPAEGSASAAAAASGTTNTSSAAAVVAAAMAALSTSSSTDTVSDETKMRICRNFILSAPPGEFTEVFNDVRILLGNDALMKERGQSAFVQYSEDQFTPVDVEGVTGQVLITRYARLADGRYLDPRTKTVFRFDHIRKESRDAMPMERTALVELSEGVRVEFEVIISAYVADHFRHGCCAVYAPKDDVIAVCIEDHNFQPDNQWNGRWRSEWLLQRNTGQLTGKIRVDVHYYEGTQNSNVQLKTFKDVSVTLAHDLPPAEIARQMVGAMAAAEKEFQIGLNESYANMSDTTFKALRRALPVTRTKMEWDKLVYYQVGADVQTKHSTH